MHQDLVRPKSTPFFRKAFGLLTLYFRSEEWVIAWSILVLIIAITLGIVKLLVFLNGWNAEFYNAIQQKNFSEFKHLLTVYAGLASIFVFARGYQIYLQQFLEIRWRRWLTNRYLSIWLTHKRSYLLELQGQGADNPDQRIAEDVKLFSRYTIDLFFGLLSSVSTLVSFCVILWNLSGDFEFSLNGRTYLIRGYMLWAAILYAIVGSLLTHFIGKRLVMLNFRQQRFEADFRYALVRVRENSEAITLLKGEEREKLFSQQIFTDIVLNWRKIMRTRKYLSWFNSGYDQLAGVFPIIVASPRYFSGVIQLGPLMQIVSAFARVQGGLSWFVENYPVIADWRASVERLIGFEDACIQSDVMLSQRNLQIEVSSQTVKGEISMHLPNGAPLSKPIPINILSGDKVLVNGPSGTGKSTLFKTLAGLWPFASGTLSRPNEDEMLFVPQKPYLPIDSLRKVLTYPSVDTSNVSDQAITTLLLAFHLPNLINKLDEVTDWSKRLSLGEQQRVVLIRAILKQPKWLFLDEPTASLDPQSIATVQKLLTEHLGASSLIVISHDPNATGNKIITV